MAFAVPAVVIFALATWICCRSFSLRVSHAVIAGCLGYYLAASQLGPWVGGVVHATVSGLIHMVGG